MKTNAKSSAGKRVSRSIGIKNLKQSRIPLISVGIQRHLVDRTYAFWWRFYEYGTTVRRPRKSRNKYLVFWSHQLNQLIKVRQVAAIQARPFLRPAIDLRKKEVYDGVNKNIKKALLRFLKRHKKKFG